MYPKRDRPHSPDNGWRLAGVVIVLATVGLFVTYVAAGWILRGWLCS